MFSVFVVLYDSVLILSFLLTFCFPNLHWSFHQRLRWSFFRLNCFPNCFPNCYHYCNFLLKNWMNFWPGHYNSGSIDRCCTKDCCMSKNSLAMMCLIRLNKKNLTDKFALPSKNFWADYTLILNCLCYHF